MAMRPHVALSDGTRPLTTEQQIEDLLDGLAAFGVVSFHDRRVKRTLLIVDHVVVAPSGIYVVDVRRWSGRIELRERGNVLRRSERLAVAGHDRTRIVDGVVKKASILRRSLGGFQIPVHAVLCFVDGDWPLWARPIDIRGATVMWPKELERRAKQLGRVNVHRVVTIADLLEQSLPTR